MVEGLFSDADLDTAYRQKGEHTYWTTDGNGRTSFRVNQGEPYMRPLLGDVLYLPEEYLL